MAKGFPVKIPNPMVPGRPFDGQIPPQSDKRIYKAINDLNLQKADTGSGTVAGVRTVQTSVTLTNADSFVAVNAAAGNLTITLPSTPTSGQVFTVKKIDSSTHVVTIQPQAGQIDGAATASIHYQYSALEFVYAAPGIWYIK